MRTFITSCMCVLLAACSGGFSPPAVPERQQSRADAQEAQPTSGFDVQTIRAALNAGVQLLYVSGVATGSSKGSVDVYLANFMGRYPRVGRITGIDNPFELAIDRAGMLYVAQNDPGAPILVFPFASPHPSLMLDTNGADVTSVAPLPNGDVAAASVSGGNFVGLLFYKPGKSEPFRKLAGNFFDGITALAADRDGDIYAHYAVIDFGFPVAELPDGSSTLRYNITTHKIEPGVMLLDASGNIVVQNADAPKSQPVDIYPPGSRIKHTYFANTVLFQSAALDATGRVFYGGAGSIYAFAYPKGTPIATIPGNPNDNTFGIATYPARAFPPPWKQ